MLYLSVFAILLSGGCERGTPNDGASAEPTSDSTLVDVTDVGDGVHVTKPSEFLGGLDIVSETSTPESDGVMVVQSVCRSADPAIDSASRDISLWSIPIVTEIHAGLFRVASDGAATIEPALAANFVVSEEGKRYEFKLKDNLKFSDGSYLSAFDVKWSWERALKKSTPWSRSRDIFGSIVGAEIFLTGKVEGLYGVEVVDDRTVTVSLIEPRSNFIALLSDPVTSILKRDNVESWHVEWTNDVFQSDIISAIDRGQAFIPFRDNMPVGAGPFKLVQYTALLRTGSAPCSLARNEHYWDRPPQLAGVRLVPDVYQLGESSEEHLANARRAFALGEVDLIYHGPVNRNSREDITVDGILQTVSLGPSTQFLAFNPEAPPFDDYFVRRALVTATDVTDFWFPIEVTWKPSLVPPSLDPAYDGCLATPVDIDVALAEIEESKYYPFDPDEVLVEYWTNVRGASTDRLERLFDKWRRMLSVYVKIEHLTNVDELIHFKEINNVILRDIVYSPVIPDLHSILGVFYGIFGDESVSDEFQHIEMMLDNASAEHDAGRRMLIYREMECYLLENALVVPLAVGAPSFDILIQPWMKGFNPPRFSGSMFKDVWFDDTAPNRELPLP